MAYYREYHGFDPISAIHVLKEPQGWEPGAYRYEATFPLARDPALQHAGVEIVARVDFSKETRVHNRIVFHRGGKERGIDCIHTAVCTMDSRELFERPRDPTGTDAPDEDLEARIVEYARTTEIRPVTLAPEEHFVSLKSYVAGIAEMGLLNLMTASYYSEALNPTTLPFGFNSYMQKQLLSALRGVAPRVTRYLLSDFLGCLLEQVPTEWLFARWDLIDTTYGLSGAILEDARLFESLLAAYPDHARELGRWAVQYEDVDPLILERLAKARSGEVLEAIARNPHLTRAHARVLASSLSYAVKYFLNRNPATSPETRRALARYIHGPPGQLVTLHGHVLVKREADILLGLEYSNNIRLERHPEIGTRPRAYCVEGHHVTGLALSDHQVSYLSPRFEDLRHLRTLRLRNASLRWLPEALGNLATLELLDLRDNPHLQRTDQTGRCLDRLREQGCEVLVDAPGGASADSGFGNLREEMLRELRRLQALLR